MRATTTDIDVSSATDNDLIREVKESNNDLAFAELVERHSGIYVRMVMAYAPKDTVIDNFYDFLSSREFNIYKAINSFDETRGTKFSTYLGNHTKWLCLNANSKRRSIPLSETFHEIPDEPQRASSQEEELSLLASIMGDVRKMPDERVSEIFRMRYSTENDSLKMTPWKEIAKKLDLSIQGCINIHNAVIEKLKKTKKYD